MINELQSKIENYLQKDKLEHFFFGTLISFLSVILVQNIEVLPKWFIIAPCLLIAVTKELIDKYVRGLTFDLIDIIYTVSSSIILYFIL